jgi:putative transposase
MPSVQHQQQGRLNNRTENFHQPTRERERRMRGFKSVGHAQRVSRYFWGNRNVLSSGPTFADGQDLPRSHGPTFRQWSEVINPSFASQ